MDFMKDRANTSEKYRSLHGIFTKLTQSEHVNINKKIFTILIETFSFILRRSFVLLMMKLKIGSVLLYFFLGMIL